MAFISADHNRISFGSLQFSVKFILSLFVLLHFLGCSEDESENRLQLVLSTPKVVLNESGRGEFQIALNGDGQDELNIESQPEWLNVSYASLIVSKSGIPIEISADLGLLSGRYVGSLVLTTTGGGRATLLVEYNKLATGLGISENILEFGYFEQEKSFYVENSGFQTLNWEIVNTNTLLQIEPSSGAINVGASTLVTVTIDRGALGNGTFDYTIRIKDSETQLVEQVIRINHFIEEKLLISGTVVDAEYDRINDVLVFVTSNPNEIRKYNPVSGEILSLALNMPPNAISIGQTGNFAAVGHNGRFSYIDLTTMQLERMYDVTCDANDIILAPNDWVYVFQKDYQGTEFRCVKLEDGAESLSAGGFNYYNSKAKLHPSGNYLYVANNGLSPSDFDKYDISSGPALYLYDSPYHGDFEFNGNIWIDEAGNRLFSKSRNVFDSTEEQSTDMRYDGVLEGNQMIAAMDIHSQVGKLYAILETGDGYPKVPSNSIRRYNAEFLTYQSEIQLPGFIEETQDGIGRQNASEGHFGFFNSSGTQFYILLKDTNNESWAIMIVD